MLEALHHIQGHQFDQAIAKIKSLNHNVDFNQLLEDKSLLEHTYLKLQQFYRENDEANIRKILELIWILKEKGADLSLPLSLDFEKKGFQNFNVYAVLLDPVDFGFRFQGHANNSCVQEIMRCYSEYPNVENVPLDACDQIADLMIRRLPNETIPHANSPLNTYRGYGINLAQLNEEERVAHTQTAHDVEGHRQAGRYFRALQKRYPEIKVQEEILDLLNNLIDLKKNHPNNIMTPKKIDAAIRFLATRSRAIDVAADQVTQNSHADFIALIWRALKENSDGVNLIDDPLPLDDKISRLRSITERLIGCIRGYNPEIDEPGVENAYNAGVELPNTPDMMQCGPGTYPVLLDVLKGQHPDVPLDEIPPTASDLVPVILDTFNDIYNHHLTFYDMMMMKKENVDDISLELDEAFTINDNATISINEVEHLSPGTQIKIHFIKQAADEALENIRTTYGNRVLSRDLNSALALIGLESYADRVIAENKSRVVATPANIAKWIAMTDYPPTESMRDLMIEILEGFDSAQLTQSGDDHDNIFHIVCSNAEFINEFNIEFKKIIDKVSEHDINLLNRSGMTALSCALKTNISEHNLIELLNKGAIVENDELNVKLFEYCIKHQYISLAKKCLESSLPKSDAQHRITLMKMLRNPYVSEDLFSQLLPQIAESINDEALTEPDKLMLMKFILESLDKAPKNRSAPLFALLNKGDRMLEWSKLLTSEDFTISSLLKIDNPALFETLLMKIDFNSEQWKVAQRGPFPNHPSNYLNLVRSHPLHFAKVFNRSSEENKIYLINTFCQNYISFFTDEPLRGSYLLGIKQMMLHCNAEQLKSLVKLIPASDFNGRDLKTICASFSVEELKELLEKHGENLLSQKGPAFIELILKDNKYDTLKPTYERLENNLFKKIQQNPQLLREISKEFFYPFMAYLTNNKIDADQFEPLISVTRELCTPRELAIEHKKMLFSLIPSQPIPSALIATFIKDCLDDTKATFNRNENLLTLITLLLDKEIDIPLEHLAILQQNRRDYRIQSLQNKINSAFLRKFFRCFETEPINDTELTELLSHLNFKDITEQQLREITKHTAADVIQKVIKRNVHSGFCGKLVTMFPKETASLLQDVLASAPINSELLSLIVANSDINVLINHLPHDLPFIAKTVKLVSHGPFSAALINEAKPFSVNQEALIDILPVVFSNIASHRNQDAFFDKLPKDNEAITKMVLNEALRSKQATVLNTLCSKMTIEQLSLMAPDLPQQSYLERFLPHIRPLGPEMQQRLTKAQRNIQYAQNETDIDYKVNNLTPEECYHLLNSTNASGMNLLCESASQNNGLQTYFAFKLFEKAFSHKPLKEQLTRLANSTVNEHPPLYLAAQADNVKFMTLFIKHFPFLHKTLNQGPKNCPYAITAAAQVGALDAVQSLVTLDQDGYWHELWYPYYHPKDTEGKTKTLFHQLACTETTGQAINTVLNHSKNNETKFFHAVTSKVDQHGISPFGYLLQNPNCDVILGNIAANFKKWGFVGKIPWRLEHIFDFETKRNNGYTDLEWAIKCEPSLETIAQLKANVSPVIFNKAEARIQSDSERDWVKIEVEPMEVENTTRKSLRMSQGKAPVTPKEEPEQTPTIGTKRKTPPKH